MGITSLVSKPLLDFGGLAKKGFPMEMQPETSVPARLVHSSLPHGLPAPGGPTSVGSQRCVGEASAFPQSARIVPIHTGAAANLIEYVAT